MSLGQSLLSELDGEAAITRRVLERVSNDRLSFRPHPKSMTLGRLASHVAEIPIWGTNVNQDGFDFVPGRGPAYTSANFGSTRQIVEFFDKNVVAMCGALEEAREDAWTTPWSLRRNGRVIWTMPRIGMLRTWVFNHTIHHRGQLSVYLRLTATPVPTIYGPSADEAAKY